MDPIIGGALIGAGGSALGMIGQRQREKRAMSNQKELMGIQLQNQQQLNKQGQEMQLDTWKKTNYSAQMQEMKQAGLNPALMYGMSGGGGATTGSQGGGSAQSGSAPTPQPMDIGMMIQAALAAAEIKLKEAQTENVKATTESTGQDVVSKTFDNEINAANRETIEQARRWNWDRDIIKGEEENAAWEFKKAIEYNDDFKSQDSPKAKAKKAEMNTIIENLKTAQINNDVQGAEAIIRDFEAKLQSEGISRSAPWYAKLVVDLMTKAGITTNK